MIKHSLIAAFVATLLLILVSCSYAEIIYERGSLIEFFAGHEEGCAYDNWLSHISEGIARPGFNDYGPAELDSQRNGFGAFQIIDSLQNPDRILADWYRIFANILADELDTASLILDNSFFANFYDIVVLTDQNEEYVILRETLDNNYFDDNGTEDQSDDVRGSFRYGWGIYIFNRNPQTPNIVLEVPHPCDDFVVPFVGIDTFIRMGAAAIFVTGAGREVKWTNVGLFDNSKSRSDPTRVGNRSAFNEAHKAVVDSIRNEFVVVIHSYDSGGRELAQCLLACYPDASPNLPILDWQNHHDILHLTPLFPIAANTIGNAEHEAVRIDNYYAIWEIDSPVYYNHEFLISNDLESLVGWPSPQRSYSTDHNELAPSVENYMHVEHDEFPDVIREEILSFYPVGGVPTYQTYANVVEFYRPLYDAVYAYYHRSRSVTVPDDFPRVQAAIDASFGGDTIIVKPGVYRESINYHHKNLVIASEFMTSGDNRTIDATIIESDTASVVTFAGFEAGSARLSGFTIRGGNSLDGGGISIVDASPRIDHCVVTANTAEGYGGGIFCGNSRPVITNCTVTGNQAGDGGGGLFGWNGSMPVLVNTILTGNEPAQIEFLRLGEPNTLTCEYSDVLGGLEGIVTGNNVQILWHESNFDADPMFLGPEQGNFRLSPFSPCVNSGSPLGAKDADSTVADVGALAIHFRNIVTTPGRLDFAGYEIGLPDSLELMISNVGSDTIEILPRDISPHNSPFSIGGANEAVDLLPDSSLTVWVLFAPQDSGDHRATLLIASDQPGEEVTRITVRASLLGVDDSGNPAPSEFRLLGAYPNPFNSTVSIGYQTPVAGVVTLKVFDLSGREVATLASGRQGAGEHRVVWSADGQPAGLYFCRMEAGGVSRSVKMVLVR